MPSDNLNHIIDKLRIDFDMKLTDLSKISVTGGGSFKCSKELHDIFGDFSVVDEIESAVKGVFFMFEKLEKKELINMKFPVLLANVGTGASFILIQENKHYKRVGGTNLAGGTMTGILSLSKETETETNNSNNLSKLIESGEKNNVDVLVRDIYGSEYSTIGLDGSIVAGSLAKLSAYSENNLNSDVAASTAYMICGNLVHLLYLYASLNGALSVIFGGSFPSIPAISRLLNNMTNTKLPIESKILELGGYLGCFGIVANILLDQ